MCPECNSENTKWLRGEYLEGARRCYDCQTVYADNEIFDEDDVDELKRSYPKIHLSDKVYGTLIIF